MECELDVIDALNAVFYNGPCLQNDVLTNALAGGLKSHEFRDLVAWLTHELHVLRKTDEEVSSEGLDDASEFAMELSALLKELGCPYQEFVLGPLSERFQTHSSLMQLLDYLLSELMATKMSMKLRPAEQSYVIPKFETNTAKSIEQLTRDLQMGKPPENIGPKALFDKLNFKVEERLLKVKPGVLSEPLLRTTKPLTDAQWKQLEALHNDLDSEYNLRRQVLLTRLEVTIQSFQWSDKVKTQKNEIMKRFQNKMKKLEELRYGGDETNIVALLAARTDLAIIEKTSSSNVRKNTSTNIQKHVIGAVPDRGGRANEHAPPPPEMPSWQQQRASGQGGRGGGRGIGGGGGAGGGRGGGNIRGGRGGAGGSGGGGGGNWQQQQPQQQPQFNQQRPQFEQQRDQNNWMSGSGRVQGTGWNQQGRSSGAGDYERDEQQNGRNSGGGGGGGRDHYNQPRRGQANYYRGGRGGRR